MTVHEMQNAVVGAAEAETVELPSASAVKSR